MYKYFYCKNLFKLYLENLFMYVQKVIGVEWTIIIINLNAK